MIMLTTKFLWENKISNLYTVPEDKPAAFTP